MVTVHRQNSEWREWWKFLGVEEGGPEVSDRSGHIKEVMNLLCTNWHHIGHRLNSGYLLLLLLLILYIHN